MNIPLQQTPLWQSFQNDLNEKTFFEKNQDFQYLAIKKSTPLGTYLYCPYGPYLAKKSALKPAYASLEALAKAESAIFIRIEPQSPENANFLPKIPTSSDFIKKVQKSKDLNPKDTWVLDLTPEKSAIISGFDQSTRTRYNQFAKKGLSVTTSKNPSDIKYLVDLQQKLAKTKKIGTFSENYLKTELKQPFSTLYLVHYTEPDTPETAKNNQKNQKNLEIAENSPEKSQKTDKIIAVSLFFDDETTRYYMQSAADADFKKLPATVALLTTALFDAKEKGLKSFDFWGIAPENAPKNHPWAGFTTFKKSFGGTPVHYCGTYDLILHPLKYRLYNSLRRANKSLRRLLKK